MKKEENKANTEKTASVPTGTQKSSAMGLKREKKKMYKTPSWPTTGIKRNVSKQGEPLEHKIERMVSNKEPIKDGAPLIYTERAEGVKGGYNVRTDRFDVALDATDKISRSFRGRREEKADMKPEKGGQHTDNVGKPESTQGGSAGADTAK